MEYDQVAGLIKRFQTCESSHGRWDPSAGLWSDVFIQHTSCAHNFIILIQVAFFSTHANHLICGDTSSEIVSTYLKLEIEYLMSTQWTLNWCTPKAMLPSTSNQRALSTGFSKIMILIFQNIRPKSMFETWNRYFRFYFYCRLSIEKNCFGAIFNLLSSDRRNGLTFRFTTKIKRISGRKC